MPDHSTASLNTLTSLIAVLVLMSHTLKITGLHQVV
jgi:hypothetical protein